MKNTLLNNKDSPLKAMLLFLLFVAATTQSQAELENATCKACHPLIYQEYRNSMHSKASIYKDAVHKAVWDLHPAKAKGNYNCAKCHTPSDHRLMKGKSKLTDNTIQQNEPISCQQCHKIQSIEKHARANKNILTNKKKYFFSADKEKKGKKVEFKEESSFFGLFTKTIGSPYHDIDYSNENFYNGNACMGCHSHKENGKGFAVCDLEVKQGDSKETCISCHMPKVQGPLANQKEHGVHAYHGANIHSSDMKALSKYIKFALEKDGSGFTVTIKNEATHTLFPQPLRLAQLRVTIERSGSSIPLRTNSFARVIGSNGKASMPWLADTIISDNSIKALETRKIKYDTMLQEGDQVVVTFGYYIVNPKAAKKLNIADPEATRFIVLKEERFTF